MAGVARLSGADTSLASRSDKAMATLSHDISRAYTRHTGLHSWTTRQDHRRGIVHRVYRYHRGKLFGFIKQKRLLIEITVLGGQHASVPTLVCVIHSQTRGVHGVIEDIVGSFAEKNGLKLVIR